MIIIIINNNLTKNVDI